jgi:hypothetical protein
MPRNFRAGAMMALPAAANSFVISVQVGVLAFGDQSELHQGRPPRSFRVRVSYFDCLTLASYALVCSASGPTTAFFVIPDLSGRAWSVSSTMAHSRACGAERKSAEPASGGVDWRRRFISFAHSERTLCDTGWKAYAPCGRTNQKQNFRRELGNRMDLSVATPLKTR